MIPKWDEEFIHQLKMCDSEKPILSHTDLASEEFSCEEFSLQGTGRVEMMLQLSYFLAFLE